MAELIAGIAARRGNAPALIDEFGETDWSTFDERVNRLHENVVWGMRGNFLDVPTDCPQRDERMGWSGDAQAFIQAKPAELTGPKHISRCVVFTYKCILQSTYRLCGKSLSGKSAASRPSYVNSGAVHSNCVHLIEAERAELASPELISGGVVFPNKPVA